MRPVSVPILSRLRVPIDRSPKDERLFALAEARDVTPLRDEAGRIVQIPHLERMLMETVGAIRLYQFRPPAHKRLSWNRVLLYVWPSLGLQTEVASECDHIHNVQRAQRVGSIDHVIPAATLRPYLIEALERGIQREL